MSDLPDDTQPQEDLQTNRDPLWNTLVDVAPEGPSKDAMTEIVAGLNDYQKKTELVAANEAAGENFVNDLSGWKNGMEAAVRNDPLFVHTAMDVTVPFIEGTAGQIDPQHVDTLIGGMHHDLATLSVYSAAEKNGDLARSLLDNERIKSNLSDEEQGALGRYIGFQDDARQRDSAAQQQVAASKADNYRDQTAMKYMQALGEFLPPNFHSEVLADTTLTPSMKGALGDMATKIMRDGPNEFTDPFALEDMARRQARGERVPVEEFMAAVTNGDMKLEDSRHVAMAGKQESGALLQHLTSAREYLMGADGENGAAGAQAYKNFANFFMNQYNATGAQGLDPKADAWIMRSPPNEHNYAAQVLNAFRPSGDDLIFNDMFPSPVDTAEKNMKLNTLENIFGKNKPSGDPVITPQTKEELVRPRDFSPRLDTSNKPKRS